MISRVYKLTEKQKIEVCFKELRTDTNNILVRPTYMSICAADQRYYNFLRPKEVLNRKLPMALIHESIGEVVYDPLDEIKRGQKVILIPTIPTEKDTIIEENYLRSSKFRSSGYDGFLQELVDQPRDRVVYIPNGLNDEVMSFSELMTVALHAIKRFDDKAHSRREKIGIWGDGTLGFITALLLKELYPKTKVIIVGKNDTKLRFFSFADEIYQIQDDLSRLKLDHAFECVGGVGSYYALNQIIDNINPEGVISMLGVSEDLVDLNTRMCLEKGLVLLGNSRSSKDDFSKLVKILADRTELIGYFENLVTTKITVKSLDDINIAFESDKVKIWGKTVIKWEI